MNKIRVTFLSGGKYKEIWGIRRRVQYKRIFYWKKPLFILLHRPAIKNITKLFAYWCWGGRASKNLLIKNSAYVIALESRKI
jgi:hypothetical protein